MFIEKIANIFKNRKSSRKNCVVTFDKNIIKCKRPNGAIESVKWNELQAVIIETTDQGPVVDDIFWILLGKNDSGCVIPSESIGVKKILKAMQGALNGFDNEKVIEAMSCCENNKFLIWSSNCESSTI
jgi:hypothetical protein